MRSSVILICMIVFLSGCGGTKNLAEGDAFASSVNDARETTIVSKQSNLKPGINSEDFYFYEGSTNTVVVINNGDESAVFRLLFDGDSSLDLLSAVSGRYELDNLTLTNNLRTDGFNFVLSSGTSATFKVFSGDSSSFNLKLSVISERHQDIFKNGVLDFSTVITGNTNELSKKFFFIQRTDDLVKLKMRCAQGGCSVLLLTTISQRKNFLFADEYKGNYLQSSDFIFGDGVEELMVVIVFYGEPTNSLVDNASLDFIDRFNYVSVRDYNHTVVSKPGSVSDNVIKEVRVTSGSDHTNVVLSHINISFYVDSSITLGDTVFEIYSSDASIKTPIYQSNISFSPGENNIYLGGDLNLSGRNSYTLIIRSTVLSSGEGNPANFIHFAPIKNNSFHIHSNNDMETGITITR